MSYQHALTCRFGDETPFYVFDSEANDKVPFSSFHELRSYTLSSQFLDKVNMHKTYFSVPYKAIMPNTWDLFYVPPTHGDDVPNDVSPCYDGALNFLSSFFMDYFSSYSGTSISGNGLVWFVRGYLLLESFFSDGSLLSLMGCKLNKYFGSPSNPNCQFESFARDFSSYFIDALDNIQGQYLTVKTSDSERFLYLKIGSDLPKMLRIILEFCRDNSDFISFTINGNDFVVQTTWNGDEYMIDSQTLPINFSRCAAYQLCYFHYLTNDKVDFIYSAELFRNYMLYHCNIFFYDMLPFFNYNGFKVLYDWCSSKFIDSAFRLINIMNSPDDLISSSAYYYLMDLLTIRKSLKFGDYFTGSRPQPYAVGDMTAPVVGNGVSAIDMTRNIMAQRFLNAVNKTGRKISDYLKGIRGANTMPLLTDPKFLARDTTTIGTMEVENTANNQGNVVSLLRAEQSKYAFEADIEDPCIILGIVSFSVPRMYSRTIDRFFFKKEREDYFNPYFQNIGDQEILAAEKSPLGGSASVPFAYTLRHMEYKQRYPIASGGVVEYLKSWFFVADNEEGEDIRYTNLSPEFIRSHNTEFDRFYASLEGTSLSSYFHFIIRFVNESNPNRNMEYSPTIL